jgi:hypothetical protein
MVPLATVIILAFINQAVSERHPSLFERKSKFIRVTCGIVLGLLAIAGGIRFGIEYYEKIQAKEQAMYKFVQVTHQDGEKYLIPIKMQDFRLETGAPIFVDFKSIPYLDDEVLEWYRRIQLATKFYDNEYLECSSLEGLRQEGISRVIFESNDSPIACEQALEIYRDSNYSIYQINTP